MGKRAVKDANKPKGKMSAYAYFVQICREEHKKKNGDEKVSFAKFSKKCSERWRSMNDKEKGRFRDMADNDKKRYDEEMKSYVPPKGEKGKKRKRTKDPNAPKRSLSAFFFFCNEERGAIKAAHPEHGVGDIAKELGKMWNQVDETTKSKFEAKAAKDKLRYEADMEVYRGGVKKVKPAEVKKVETKKESEEEEEEEEEEEVEEGEEAEEEEEEEEDDE